MTVRMLPEGWPDHGKGRGEAKRQLPLTAPRLREPPGQPGQPVIELRGLDLHMQSRVAAPGNAHGRAKGQPKAAPAGLLDLTVWQGELVMLTGQPKSGRSALLNVLGLLDRPATGSYLLNGVDTGRLRDRDRSALRGRLIGFVFQRRILLPTRSVLDNVMLPLRYTGVRKRARLISAAQSLDRVGLAAQANLMTWQLSAGELALCAVARALVTQPNLLLCDDPTAGVEQESATKLIGLLAGLHREGKTVLIATADQLAAAHSSRSVQLGAPAATGIGSPPASLGPVSEETAAITDAGWFE